MNAAGFCMALPIGWGGSATGRSYHRWMPKDRAVLSANYSKEAPGSESIVHFCTSYDSGAVEDSSL
jgi:hypothetical protein